MSAYFARARIVVIKVTSVFIPFSISLRNDFGLLVPDIILLGSERAICRISLNNLVDPTKLPPSNLGVVLIICSVIIPATFNALRLILAQVMNSFYFFVFFPVQQSTSGIGHRAK